MVKQNDWATLHAKIKNCTECSLASTRHNAVCGEGNRQASIMFIAQAPGEKEDLKGRMFLGPSGKIFRELLQNIDLDLEKCYLTNLLKCRLPSNRRPRKDEIHQCATYLYHEIELVQPNLLVLLGYYATREIFRFYNLPIPERRKFRE
ncbi:MAG: uracil-DNA glycosylase, partial [Candidatus Cloacimonetes bacterium]|nr:uracil-DNA glycosylase [Candidatus Cloacimonadota bacterium]